MFTELIKSKATQKHRLEAEAEGLVLIGAGDDVNQRNYRFIECNHEQKVKISHVRDGKVRCRKCLDQKLKNEAETAGLLLLGSSDKGYAYRKYRLSCGHTSDVSTFNVRNGEFKCRQCFNNRLSTEAELIGLKLTGDGKNSDYRKYELPCGHRMDANPSEIRRGHTPTCIECGDNHYTKQSHLYIAEFKTKSGNKAVKLGLANNMNARELSWLLREGVTSKILALWLCETKINLVKIESEIHSKSGIQGLSAKEGKEFVGSGYTEFYSTDKLNKLIQAASDPKHGLLRLQ